MILIVISLSFISGGLAVNFTLGNNTNQTNSTTNLLNITNTANSTNNTFTQPIRTGLIEPIILPVLNLTNTTNSTNTTINLTINPLINTTNTTKNITEDIIEIIDEIIPEEEIEIVNETIVNETTLPIINQTIFVPESRIVEKQLSPKENVRISSQSQRVGTFAIPVAKPSITPKYLFESTDIYFNCSGSDSDLDSITDTDFNIYLNNNQYLTDNRYPYPETLVQWEYEFDASGQTDAAYSVAVDPNDGSVYVVGTGYDLLSTSSRNDWWLKKFSHEGVEDNNNWNKVVATLDNGDDYAYSVDVAPNGNVFIAGLAFGAISSSNDPDNDYILKGYSSSGSTLFSDKVGTYYAPVINYPSEQSGRICSGTLSSIGYGGSFASCELLCDNVGAEGAECCTMYTNGNCYSSTTGSISSHDYSNDYAASTSCSISYSWSSSPTKCTGQSTIGNCGSVCSTSQCTTMCKNSGNPSCCSLLGWECFKGSSRVAGWGNERAAVRQSSCSTGSMSIGKYCSGSTSSSSTQSSASTCRTWCNSRGTGGCCEFSDGACRFKSGSVTSTPQGSNPRAAVVYRGVPQSNEAYYGVVTSSSNVYSVGMENGAYGDNSFLDSYSFTGTQDWDKADATPSIKYAVEKDSSDNIYTLGYNLGSAYIQKFNSAGTEQGGNWPISISSVYDGNNFDLAIDSSDNIYVLATESDGGWIIRKYSSDGSEITSGWAKTNIGGTGAFAYSIVVDKITGDVYAAGTDSNLVSGSSGYDWWIKKYSSTGVEDLDWSVSFDGSNTDDRIYGISISPFNDSSVYVVGRLDNDFAIKKLGAAQKPTQGDIWTLECRVEAGGEWSSKVNYSAVVNPPAIVHSVSTSNDTSSIVYRDNIIEGYCNGSTNETSITYNYQWFVGGSVVSSGSSSVLTEGQNNNVANLTLSSYVPEQEIVFSCNGEINSYTSPWQNSSTITIKNSVPTANGSFSNTPIFASETFDVICDANDVDSMDNLSIESKVYKNNINIENYSIIELNQSDYPKTLDTFTNLVVGDKYNLTCNSFDGYNWSGWSSNTSVTIIADAILNSVSTSNDSTSIAYRGETLQGFCNGSSNDGDITYNYEWFVDGTSIGTGSVQNVTHEQNTNVDNLSLSSYEPLQEITFSCNVEKNGYESPWQNSTIITITNKIPQINTYIQTATPLTTDDFSGFCNASDGDGDTVSYEYKWYKNDTEYSSGNTAFLSEGLLQNLSTINAGETQSWQEWIFSCKVDDSYNTTDWHNSSTIQILNTPPTITNPVISHVTAFTNNTINCSFIVSDNDTADELFAQIEWYKDGLFSHSNIELVNNSQVHESYLYPSRTTKHDTWSCKVNGRDNFVSSTEKNSSNVTILNHPGWISNLELYRPVNMDPIEARISYFDIDNDQGSINVKWFNNGTNTENDTVVASNGTKYSIFYNISYNKYDFISLEIYATDNEANTTNYSLSIPWINNTNPYSNETILISGSAIYYNGTPQSGRAVYLNINDALANSSTTNSSGNYSYIHRVANSSHLGLYQAKVNFSDSLLTKINSTAYYTVWAPTVSVLENNANYSLGENANHTFTLYYNRTDTNTPIPGELNITISNSTLNQTTTCLGTNNCTISYNVGPTGDYIGQEVTIYTSTINDSVYYWPEDKNYSFYLEEPLALPTYDLEQPSVEGLTSGTEKNISVNITIINSNKATIINPIISNYFTSPIVLDVYDNVSCSNISPNTNCTFVKTLSIDGDAELGNHLMRWQINWTNNNGSISSTIKDMYITVAGNPGIDISPKIINQTYNNSQTNNYSFYLNNTGNERLSEDPSDHITIDISGIDSSWFDFYSVKGTSEGLWDDSNQWFSLLFTGDYFDVITSINVDNFTPANYTGTITFAGEASIKTVRDNITVYIEVDPQMEVVENITQSINHDNSIIRQLRINSTGNTKLTNVTLTHQGSGCDFLIYNNTVGDIVENSYSLVDLNISIPKYTDAGTYNCLIYTNSTNEQSATTNLSIDVLPSGTWDLTPLTNTQVDFNLNDVGEMGNYSITNTGNIPLNFSIIYDKTLVNPQGESCVGNFQPSDDCMDYYENGYNPSYVYVDKNQTAVIPFWSVGDGQSHNPVEIKITFQNSTATPPSQDRYFNLTIINMPPEIVNISATDTQGNKGSVELNKSIDLLAFVGDDELNKLNENSAYFNITIDGKTYRENASYQSFFYLDGSYYGGGKYSASFNKTNVTGNAQVTFFVEDLTSNYDVDTYNFDILGTTNIDFSTNTPIADKVSLANSQNVTLDVDISNSGLTNAYNISITTSQLPSQLSATARNISNISQGTTNTNLTITVANNTPPDSYPFSVNLTYTNPDGSTSTVEHSAAVVVSINEEYIITGLEDPNFDVEHNQDNLFSFNISAIGNYDTSIQILTQNEPTEGTITYSDDNITYHDNLAVDIPLGDTQTIYMNIRPDKGAPAITKDFILTATSPQQDFEINYTVADDYSWSTSVSELNISSVYGEIELNDRTIIFNNANNPLSFIASLTGNITNLSGYSGEGIILLDTVVNSLAINSNKTVRLNYTVPDYNGLFVGSLIINRTSGPNKDSVIIPVNFRSYKFIVGLSDLEIPSKARTGQIINITANLSLAGEYMTDNLSYIVSVGGQDCPLVSEIPSGNKTILRCRLPSLTDATSYDLRVTANYTKDGQYVYPYNLLTDRVYYKDISPPKIHSLTAPSVETGATTQIDINISDNNQIDEVLLTVTNPSGVETNVSLVKLGDIFTGYYSSTNTLGVYTVDVFVNDTDNNQVTNSTNFESYTIEYFSGRLVDQEFTPIVTDFHFVGTESFADINFSTDSLGYFNHSLQRKKYNISLEFSGFNLSLYEQSLVNIPNNLLVLDRLTNTDISDELAGAIYGFSSISDLSSSGEIVMDYTSVLDLMSAEDNLEIYHCLDFNYTTKDCLGIWWPRTTTIYKNNNLAHATFNSFSSGTIAFILKENEPSNLPILDIPFPNQSITAEHGTSVTAQIGLQNSGEGLLSDINIGCETGCDWFVSSNEPSVLASGGAVTVNFGFDVPVGTNPGEYTTKFSISSSDSRPTVTNLYVFITVPTNTSLSLTAPSTNFELGSNARVELTNVTLANSGNIIQDITLNTTSTAGGISLDDYEFVLYKTENVTFPVSINNTDTVGLSYHTIDSGNGSITFQIGTSKTAVINSVTPSSSLQAGDSILISVDAYNLGIAQTGTPWDVYVGGVPCDSLVNNNNVLNCTLPSVSDSIVQELKVKTTIEDIDAYDYEIINYEDIYGPYLVNNDEEELSYQNGSTPLSVFESIYDDNKLNNAVITIKTPQGTQTTLGSGDVIVENNNLTFNYTFSQSGDYYVNFTLYDNLSNSRTQQKIYENYKPISFSGNSTGYSDLRFKLKKRANSDFDLIQTDSNGTYTSTIQKRKYHTFQIIDSLNEITFYNITFTEPNPIKNISSIEGELVSIAETSNRVGGFAIDTSINTSNISLHIKYVSGEVTNPSSLAIYRCINWSFTNNQCNDVFWTYQPSTVFPKYVETIIDGFSAYVLAEGATPSFVVGDGLCSSSEGESYANSPNDCEPSSTTIVNNGGGGGGGSSGVSLSELQDELNKSTGNLSNISNDVRNIQDSLEDLFDLGNEDLLFDVETISKQMYNGETVNGKFTIKNTNNESVKIKLNTSEELENIIIIEDKEFDLKKGEIKQIPIVIKIEENEIPGIRSGFIFVTTKSGVAKIPVDLRILENTQELPQFSIKPLISRVIPGDEIKLQLEIQNPQKSNKTFNIRIKIFNSQTGKELFTANKTYITSETITDIIKFKTDSNTEIGDYFITATMNYTQYNKTFVSTKTESFSVNTPLFKQITNAISKKIWFFRVYHLLYLIIIIILITIVTKEVIKYVESKRKYHVKVDKHSLPIPGKRTGFIGNLAESKIRAFYDLDRLTTHALVAGSTGGGKSVAGQVYVEEALQKNIAVVVFDPTAQWTGFLQKSKDKRMLRLYEQFGMKRRDAKGFSGNVHLVTNPREKIDIKKIAKPGEIQIFALNKLNFKDMDIFVANTVRQIFVDNFEESQKLDILLVYDEVHRLLPKFGGSGIGFMQIERACREFRKWGIGLLLISQVLSDFIGQIRANINTEVQVRTRDENDLDRVKTKYGEELQQAVIKASTGTGMVQNSAYNKGQPYMVSFRPLLHSTARLSDKELGLYEKYNLRIADYQFQLDQLKELEQDTFDLELELRLALEKLKIGEFSIVEIYLETLDQKLASTWKGLGKDPKKWEPELVSEDEIKNDLELARKAYEKAREKKEPSADQRNIVQEIKEESSKDKVVEKKDNADDNTEKNIINNNEKNKEIKEKTVTKKSSEQDNKTSNINEESNNNNNNNNGKTDINNADNNINSLLQNITIENIEKAINILNTQFTENNRRKDLLRLTVIKGDLEVAKVRKDNKALLNEIATKLKSLLNNK